MLGKQKRPAAHRGEPLSNKRVAFPYSRIAPRPKKKQPGSGPG